MSRTYSLGTVAALTLGALLVGAGPASAAPSYSVSNMSSAVAGTTVSVSTTIKATSTVVATRAGICARSESNQNFDFSKDANVTIGPSGTTITKTAVLPIGTYSMFSCAYINGAWPTIGPVKTFIVNGSTGANPPPLPTDGWKTVFSDDFSTNVPTGRWPASSTPAGGSWAGYNGFYDTAGFGKYTNSAVSQHDGVLDIHVRTVNGVPQVAAPHPMVNNTWGGAAYQRVTMTFKSDSLPGYKTSFLLWPDSENWNDGEIDFPESPLNSTMSGFNHCPGKPSNNCEYVNSSTRYADGNWHTSVIEWTPSAVKLYLDGNLVMTEDDPGEVPTKAMHYIAQLETNYAKPDSSVNGHFYIDKFSVEYRTS